MMEIRDAVNLVKHAIEGFLDASDPDDKLKMANVVDILVETLPKLLAGDEDRRSFEKFRGVIAKDFADVEAQILRNI